MHIASLLNSLEVRVHEWLKVWMHFLVLLDEGQLVASTKAVLQEERATDALKSAFAHDSNSVTKHISFVHVMSCQNYNSILLVRFEHVPEVATSTKIHS